jgi:hypothetical protein
LGDAAGDLRDQRLFDDIGVENGDAPGRKPIVAYDQRVIAHDRGAMRQVVLAYLYFIIRAFPPEVFGADKTDDHRVILS